MDTENAGHSLNNTTNTSYTHNLIAYVGVPCVALGTIILITVLVGWHILVNDCNPIVQDPITYYYITAKCICGSIYTKRSTGHNLFFVLWIFF